MTLQTNHSEVLIWGVLFCFEKFLAERIEGGFLLMLHHGWKVFLGRVGSCFYFKDKKKPCKKTGFLK
jgi:hypothetical protein